MTDPERTREIAKQLQTDIDAALARGSRWAVAEAVKRATTALSEPTPTSKKANPS